MANRVIREGINDSKKINALGFEAEVFYRRLFAVADDFGFFEADPVLLRSDLYKRLVDEVKIADINTWLKKCAEVGLIDLYEYDGKSYGQILHFGQILRIMRSKFPNREGKYLTKEEYLHQERMRHTSDNKLNQMSSETNRKETESNQNHESEIETWLKDLPNSSHLERISSLTGIKKDILINKIPEFRKKVDLSYPSHQKFLTHFKNWILKGNTETNQVTKTTVSFGTKKQ